MKKSKFFNNSTKRTSIETQAVEQTELQTIRKSKRKVLRGFAFGGVALMMATAGVFAFAPLGVSANQMNTKANSESIQYAPSPLGLDPENDPVIYTTEDGLEIKWGNDTSSSWLTGGISTAPLLPSGALAGYPYFTMGTYNGYAVNWVIIGRNADVVDVFTKPNSSYVFSSWKTTHNKKDKEYYDTNAYYFFNNTYETSSPAGAAVDASVSTSYVSDLTRTIPTITSTAIPSGCVLVISECHLGTSFWAAGGGSGRYASYTDARTIRANMDTLYNNNFKSLMDSRIVVNTTFSPYSHKMFALQSGHATTFLTTDALRVTGQINTPTTAQAWWLGNWYGWADNYYQGQAYHVSASGGVGACSFHYSYRQDTNWNSLGMRPACIIQLK